jgi:hypothetical protein
VANPKWFQKGHPRIARRPAPVFPESEVGSVSLLWHWSCQSQRVALMVSIGLTVREPQTSELLIQKEGIRIKILKETP